MTIDITWAGNDAELIGGADLRDKAELIGVPFKITGVSFQRNDRQVESVTVEAEDQNGEEFDFYDSSTSGIKQQIVTFLSLKGIEVDYTSGELHDVNIVVPKGLRVSNFTVMVAGKEKAAKTYYLTSGGRAARRQQQK